MKKLLCLALALTSQLSLATTQVFLSLEYQAQTAPNAGTIRSGDPAGDASFADFLNSANLVSADILSGDSCGSIADGVYATWGHVTTLGQTDINLGSGTASVSIAGWDTDTNTLTTPSGSASLAWSYENTGALQAGAPRPGFASGSGTGFGIRTNGGATSDGIRNAVSFDLGLAPVSAFGIFGGDLETGGPNGSPSGLLFVEFTNGTSETINYSPDSTLFPDATFSGTGNNTSETYGNETGRFIGIADDTRLIQRITIVVGDDDDSDDGDGEQLSFIAPITFTEVSGGGCFNHIPTNVIPEPSSAFLISLGAVVLCLRRRF